MLGYLANDYYRCSAIQRKKEEYIKRYNYGVEQEAILKTKFEDMFKRELIQKDRYAPFDFYSVNGDIQIELKSRRCNSHSYSSTLINKSKIQKVNNIDTYFFFNFYDGVYYIKYDEKVFNTFKEQETITSYSRTLNIEVPISYLHKMV